VYSGENILRHPSMKAILIFTGILVVNLASAAHSQTGKIKAFVSILPQAYFVERVGGPFVDVKVLVTPGQSPATYEPTPKQMSDLGRSQLYFRIGTPFEKSFIPKMSDLFKHLKIIDTRKGIQLRRFKESRLSQVPDPHIWLDPKLVMIQADTICNALAQLDPHHQEEYKNNLRAFNTDLINVDAKIAKTLSPLKGSKFYVFHPSFGYFGDAYGLIQVAVETEGKAPSAKQLTGIIKRAKRDNVKVIFVQPQFAKKDAQTVAKAIGGAVVPIDPLARDYLKNLEEIAENLKKALSDRLERK
jgi:zinc transport system substrate-binding protein